MLRFLYNVGICQAENGSNQIPQLRFVEKGGRGIREA